MSAPFGPLYASSYDELYREKNYRDECVLLSETFRRYAPSPVTSILDLGCGTGGHAVELARRGHVVAGVDRSPEMLRRAEAKAAAAGLSITWSCADVRDFHFDQRFDAAISMFSVLGYLTSNDDLHRCFRRVRDHLSAGSLFVFEVWFGPAVLAMRPEARRSRTVSIEGETYERESTTEIDLLAQSCQLRYSMKRQDGTVADSERHDVRFFFPQEIALLLEASGFETCRISRFPSLDVPADVTSWNAFVVSKAV